MRLMIRILAYASLFLGGILSGHAESGGAVPVAESAEQENIPLRGDSVYFKNGRVLAGVQVIRESAAAFEVLPAPDIKSLSIPRSLVLRVEYDAIKEPKGNWLLDGLGDGYDTEIIEGKEISPELHEKLTKPITSMKLSFDKKDFMEILQELAKKAEIEITFGDFLKKMPPEKREWSVEIEGDTSFLHLLQSKFSPNFPEIEWAYQFDKIAIFVKKTGATQ